MHGLQSFLDSEFIHPSREHGERGLWRAVILQAFIDSVSNCKRTESKLAKFSARAWLTGMDYNFKLVCTFANYDPYYVRRKALKFMKEDKNVSKIIRELQFAVN